MAHLSHLLQLQFCPLIPRHQQRFYDFNGFTSPPYGTTTFYLEDIADPDSSMAHILKLYTETSDRDKETNIIVATAHNQDWQSTEDAQKLHRLTRLHLIAVLPPYAVSTFSIDSMGNFHRSTRKFPNEVRIWMICSKDSTLPTKVDRAKYFANLNILRLSCH